MKDSPALARVLKALSVDARLRIVRLLKGRALCVGALSGRLDVTQGAVSQHLRILRDAGLVTGEKRGYYVHYRLNEPQLARWKGRIAELLSLPDEPQRTCPPRARKKGKEGCVRTKINKGARSPKT